MPSRFETLNVPTTRVSSLPLPHGVATESAMPSAVVAMAVAVMSPPFTP